AVLDGGRDRQRVHRGRHRALSRRAGGNRAGAVRHHPVREHPLARADLEHEAVVHESVGPGAHAGGAGGSGVNPSTWRKVKSAAFVGFCGLSIAVALVPLAFILFFVLKEGLQALDYDFFTKMPQPVGETGGGMANAILGTLIIVGLGALFAIPTGIMSGIY